MRNRLHLDWSLTSPEERTTFVTQYLMSDVFARVPPSAEELETIANYVLWARDTSGLNVSDEKLVELPRRNKAWAPKQFDSLDELLEADFPPSQTVYPLGSRTLTKTRRETFSREDARRLAPAAILSELELLWGQIDELELTLNYYDLAHGKRKKQPRAELVNAFSATEQMRLREKANSISSYKYGKLRSLLIELRRQQYTLRDSYSSSIHARGEVALSEQEELLSGELERDEIGGNTYPLGNYGEGTDEVWLRHEDILPEEFGEELIKELSTYYWAKREASQKLSSDDKWFDFRDLESVYSLISNLGEFFEEVGDESWTIDSYADTLRLRWTMDLGLRCTTGLRSRARPVLDHDIAQGSPENDEAGARLRMPLINESEENVVNTYLCRLPEFSNLPPIILTLTYYILTSQLNEVQFDILNLKLRRYKNQDIAIAMNKKYGKSYTPNYISTIFRQRVIPILNEAARTHEQLIRSLPFEEEFKKCPRCGRTYLRNPNYFCRKTRSRDGFATHCKQCDKEERANKKLAVRTQGGQIG